MLDLKELDAVIQELRKLYPERFWMVNNNSVATTTTTSTATSSTSGRKAFRVLVGTVLSQRTRDEISAEACTKLIANYPDAKALANAEIKAIEELIKPVGFYRVKSKKLKQIAEIIVKHYKGIVPDKFEELMKLPGVGRKTANCVLCFGYGKPAIPVDTHVHRITNRLGWVTTKTPEATELALRKLLPVKYWLSLNELLVRFGQTICKPVKPNCKNCPIIEYCKNYGRK